MVQGLLEEQCETHHIEGSVLHGKPDFIQTKSLVLNTENCEDLHLGEVGTCRIGYETLVSNYLKII